MTLKDNLTFSATSDANYPRERILCRPEREKTIENDTWSNSSAMVHEDSVKGKAIVSVQKDDAEGSNELVPNVQTKHEKLVKLKDALAADKDVLATIFEANDENPECKHADKKIDSFIHGKDYQITMNDSNTLQQRNRFGNITRLFETPDLIILEEAVKISSSMEPSLVLALAGKEKHRTAGHSHRGEMYNKPFSHSWDDQEAMGTIHTLRCPCSQRGRV